MRCSPSSRCGEDGSAGDTIRVRPGTYPLQCISGDKATDTKIIGDGDGDDVVVQRTTATECKAVFGGGSTVGFLGTHIWLENMRLDSLGTTGVGAGVRIWPEADDVTMVDVLVDGDFATAYIEGDRFEWYGGRLKNNPNPPQTTCFNGASQVSMWMFAPGSIIERVTFGVFNRVDVPTPNQETCTGDGIPHIETVRLEDAAENPTFRGNHFVRGSEIGSGHMFASAPFGGLKLIGNYFGQSGDNPMILQLENLSATGTAFLYNTFDPGSFVLSTANFPWVGNLGEGIIGGCSGTHTKNLWRGSGSCGTDTFVGATSLGVDTTGHLQAGSPAIDAGETTVCTGIDVGSVDFDGNIRPQPPASPCDAGADERLP